MNISHFYSIFAYTSLLEHLRLSICNLELSIANFYPQSQLYYSIFARPIVDLCNSTRAIVVDALTSSINCYFHSNAHEKNVINGFVVRVEEKKKINSMALKSYPSLGHIHNCILALRDIRGHTGAHENAGGSSIEGMMKKNKLKKRIKET